MSADDTVTTETIGDLLIVTINRPHVRNAVDGPTARRLFDRFADFDRDDTLAVAVWVGRDRGELGLSGSRAALPTWARFVSATGTLQQQAALPEGMVHVEVCAESSMPA